VVAAWADPGRPEHQLHQEVCGPVGLHAPAAEHVREFAEPAGDVVDDLLLCGPGLQILRRGERGAENLQVLRVYTPTRRLEFPLKDEVSDPREATKPPLGDTNEPVRRLPRHEKGDPRALHPRAREGDVDRENTMPRFDPRLGPDVAASLEYHRARPEITSAQHLASLEEEAACEALGTARVYLDLRYWIFLRDADLGKPQKPVHAKLLEEILRGVAEGRFVCPITEAVFFEVDRQGNTERRMQTVRMIDRLCRGIVIKNSCYRAVCEIHDFFEAASVRQELPTVPCRRVWVRPYSFLGTPQISGWGAAEDLAINKAFLSYAWTRSLEDLLTDTPVPDGSSDDALRANAVRITESSAKHVSEMRSFEQVFADEVAGLIDAHRAEIGHAFRPYAGAMLQAAGADSHDPSTVEQHALNLACSAIATPKPRRAFPLIRILAGLHAFIRWQRQRAFTFNDIFDLRHAAAAIPYCDVFLTEKFVKTACTSSLLDFGTAYGTRIICDDDEALDAVSRLAAT
jgi:hypothetical protein